MYFGARIIEDQKEISSREITGSEANEILARYGYSNSSYSTRVEPLVEQPKELTFEEMLAEQDRKVKEEVNRRLASANAPRPITFNGSNGYDTETKSSSIDGYGFKIQVSTDMKLPKY